MSGVEIHHIFLFHWHLIGLDSTRHDIDNLIFLSKKESYFTLQQHILLQEKYDFKPNLISNKTIKKTAKLI